MPRIATGLLAIVLATPAWAQVPAERISVRELEVVVTRDGREIAHETLRLPVNPDRKDQSSRMVSYERRWQDERLLKCGKGESWSEIESSLDISAGDRTGMTDLSFEWNEQITLNDYNRRCDRIPMNEERKLNVRTTLLLESGTTQRWVGEHGIVVTVTTRESPR